MMEGESNRPVELGLVQTLAETGDRSLRAKATDPAVRFLLRERYHYPMLGKAYLLAFAKRSS